MRDKLSPKLFNAILEQVIKKVRPNIEHEGIKINGDYLSHLRFADVHLVNESPVQLELLLDKLYNGLNSIERQHLEKRNYLIKETSP